MHDSYDENALRQRAEQYLRDAPESLDTLSPEEAQRLLHELRVHQIELEMQNAELRNAQEELTAAHDRYLDLYDFAPVGYLTVSVDDHILQANLASASLLGVTRRDLVGQPLSRFIAREGQEDYHFLRQRLQHSDAPQMVDLPMPKVDGTTFWARLDVIVAREAHADPAQEIPVYRLTISDVTDRKQAQAASAHLTAELTATIAVTETRYRRLFETAQDGILLLDARTGRIADVNPFLLEMLGYSFQELVGRRLWEIGPFKDMQASRSAFEELQTQRYIRYEDLPLQTAAGKQIAVEFVSNVYPVDGKQVIQCNVRDITARRQAEKALEQLNAEMHNVLEARVQERTAELAKVIEALRLETLERLRAEENERVAVVEERTRIAREIHDTLAQGFTGVIIQLEAADDVLAEDIEATRAHMQRAHRLARESLVEARRSVWALRPRLLEGGNMVTALAEMIEQYPHDASVQLEFALDGTQHRLPSDMEHDLLRIGQEAMNNAVKYASAHLVRITLTFDDCQVTLSVADDGQGFDPSEQRQRGFGLRIMAERAEHHQGKLTIASQPGHGTSIEARVPYPPDDERGAIHE